MSEFHTLPAFKLQSVVSLVETEHASNSPVTEGSPAIEVMTDFAQTQAATIHPSASLSEAGLSMNYQNVHLLLVMEDRPFIKGLITSSDLHGNKPMKVIQALKIRYNELTVDNVMTRLENLDAIDFDELHRASVGDAIVTLKNFGRNHLLVVDKENPESLHRVRGLISRSQIERQLGRNVEITRVPRSFAEIEHAVIHGDNL